MKAFFSIVLPLFGLLALILLAGTGCEVLAPRPTLAAPLELTTPTPPPTRRPSPTPRPILSPTPRPTSTVTPTATVTPDPRLPTATLEDAPPEATLPPAVLTPLAADLTATLPPDIIAFGRTVEGRPLLAQRLGNGPRQLLLIGGIHGGWEGNTVELMLAVIEHFSEEPEAIAPGLALVVIPALNADGLLRGRVEEGRFNSNGVDLNRNWGCEWSAEAIWRNQRVDPGRAAFSEPETAALADYILLNLPAAVIFYHSAANGVFAGACEGDHGSQALADAYGRAATYPSDGRFLAYRVTGDASNWVDGQGIPALTVELQSWTDPEIARNLAGIMAVQCELTRRRADSAARAWVAARCAGD